MIKAVAATVKKSEHVIIVNQPDYQKVVVQCQACGIAQSYDLPSSIPAFTLWLAQVHKAHTACALSS